MDKAKLIDAVKESPCLWRVSDSSYKDYKAKENAWKYVADQVGQSTSVEKCMVKWKSLRDRFVRELKKAKQDQGGSSFSSSWSLFNSLLFLQDSVRHRGSRATLYDSSGETGNVTHEERSQEAVPLVLPVVNCPSDSSSVDCSSPSTPSPPPSKKRKSIRGDDSVLKKFINAHEKQKQDEDQLFGLQVAATLRRLTNRQKADAKLRIQQVLFEVEFPNNVFTNQER